MNDLSNGQTLSELKKEKNILRFLKSKIIESGALVYIVLILLLLISEIVSPGFLEYKHFGSILRLASFLGIASIGQTFVILICGIDLSIASTITLANIAAAQIMNGSNANVPLALGVVILSGIIIGSANATGVKFFKIPPLVMTLGMGSVVQGISLIYSKGAPKGNAAPFLTFLSNGSIGGVINGAVLIWIILGIITIVSLKLTVFGRGIYAVGTNSMAARYSGVNVTKIIYSAYIISGISAALVGFLLVGYTGTSFLDAGTEYSMNSIAAVIVGGTTILGGRGGYGGTIAGAMIMIVLESLLTVINIPESGRQMVHGVIILLLVFVYGREKSRRA